MNIWGCVRVSIGIVTLATGLFLGACTQKVKGGEREADGTGEVLSMVGAWRVVNDNHAGPAWTWSFAEDGTCHTQASAARAHPGTYRFSKEELVITNEFGTMRYRVIAKEEPRVRLTFMRGTREFFLTMTRIPDEE